jgi:hypothetical protein
MYTTHSQGLEMTSLIVGQGVALKLFLTFFDFIFLYVGNVKQLPDYVKNPTPF